MTLQRVSCRRLRLLTAIDVSIIVGTLDAASIFLTENDLHEEQQVNHHSSLLTSIVFVILDRSVVQQSLMRHLRRISAQHRYVFIRVCTSAINGDRIRPVHDEKASDQSHVLLVNAIIHVTKVRQEGKRVSSQCTDKTITIKATTLSLYRQRSMLNSRSSRPRNEANQTLYSSA